ncbi:pyridoxine 5'-phosphate synthase [Candidatus Latescibacterota bacterium]
MAYLSMNIDYVAVIREARKTDEPDPVFAAGLVELAGAHGITVHLREDRRHIVDRDVEILRKVVRLPFNLEMAATDEMLKIASETVPDQVTFVPEKREEITTEGGLDVVGNKEKISDAIKVMKEKGIVTSLFIDPDIKQIELSKEIGSECVELHTGEYANTKDSKESDKQCAILAKAARFAYETGLEVHAGHGLTYTNVKRIADISEIKGLYIGHSIMARAVYVGLISAVKEMIQLIE